MPSLNVLDIRGMEEAKFASRLSKDPSTKVGAAIYRPDGSLVTTGYNGFPQAIADDGRLLHRETKYQIILHAEMNAFIFAKGDWYGNMLYTWPFMPCPRCAVIYIQSRIARVVAPVLPERLRERWETDIELAMELFNEAGVDVRLIDFPTE